jgi:DNA polymerase elongation subunit (family B)
MNQKEAAKLLLSKMQNGKIVGINSNNILCKSNEPILLAAKILNLCVCPNGTLYSNQAHGILPELMDVKYKERVKYKDLKIAKEKEYEQKKDISSKDELTAIKNDIAKYDLFQNVRKVQLNSAYGVMGNQYFRLYDPHIAEAVTQNGQMIIKFIANQLNSFLNDSLETEGYDYVVASDTDSVYLRLDKLVNSVFSEGTKKEKIIKYLDVFCNNVLQSHIDESFDLMCNKINAYANKIKMKRESIAERGIWVAKKKYILNVNNKEGVSYKEPKLKVMGIEMIKSSTPEFARKSLKKCIQILLGGTEKELQSELKKIEKEYFSKSISEIASPRKVNGLIKYRDINRIYDKGTPIATKASLLYNHYLKERGLTQYQSIEDGQKIKFVFLKKPNPIKDSVIAFVDTLPKELDLDKYIDYHMQYQKTFLDPLDSVAKIVGWQKEDRGSLEDFFV